MTFPARQTALQSARPIAQTRLQPVLRSAARLHAVILTLSMTLSVLVAIGVSITEWTGWSLLGFGLILPSLLWIAGGAATALVGSIKGRVSRKHAAPPSGWRPVGRTAILVLLCREDPVALAQRLRDLCHQIKAAGLGRATQVIVLSDTFGEQAIATEAAALSPLIGAGMIRYRRRCHNTGRKPGNIADWFDTEGYLFGQMMVLDADSRMSGARIARMIHHMEAAPDLGLLQAGMGLVPAQSRFGHYQRIATRLLAPPFAQGLAAWSGDTGNYWGHNALIRCDAFASAAHLPKLSGPTPFGGEILSHDFVEAAEIRRHGWRVVFDADPSGSLEDGPQDMATFHKRNRRWCQGNLQHLRLIAGKGLHPVSRLHMVSGIFSFLAAPVWLLMVILMGSGLIVLQGALPFLLILSILFLPKLCGLWRLIGPGATPWRRRIALRAFGAETVLSAVIAPIVMLHQTAAVCAVLAGRDCGWKSPEFTAIAPPQGLPEAIAGLTLISLVMLTNPAGMIWLVPMAGPMIAAPLLIRWLNTPKPQVIPA